MEKPKENIDRSEDAEVEEGEIIEQGFQQMTVLYKSRCIQAPIGSHVTVREIKKED
jgi:hypothetical protein